MNGDQQDKFARPGDDTILNQETGRMRFLQASRVPADTERLAVDMPVEVNGPAASASSKQASESEITPPDEPRGHPRTSEVARILIERIDSLASRLSACEHAIELMARQMSRTAEKQAADGRDFEDRIRRQVERQVADISVEMERRQKEFASRQAKLMELLASEINKVRTIAEATSASEPQQVTAQGGRNESRMPRARAREFGPASSPAPLHTGDNLPNMFAHGSAPYPDHGSDRRDLEFWDWLESLPAETTAPPAADDFDIEIDFDDLVDDSSR